MGNLPEDLWDRTLQQPSPLLTGYTPPRMPPKTAMARIRRPIPNLGGCRGYAEPTTAKPSTPAIPAPGAALLTSRIEETPCPVPMGSDNLAASCRCPAANRRNGSFPPPTRLCPNRQSNRTRSLLGWLARRAAGPLTIAGLAAVVANTIQAIVPAFVGAALDSGIENGLNARLWAICLSLLVLFVVYAIGDTAQSYVGMYAWMRTNFDVTRLVGAPGLHHRSRSASPGLYR